MISLESQNWQRFIGNLEFNLEKSPEKEPENKFKNSENTKHHKEVNIDNLNFKIFKLNPCKFVPAKI